MESHGWDPRRKHIQKAGYVRNKCDKTTDKLYKIAVHYPELRDDMLEAIDLIASARNMSVEFIERLRSFDDEIQRIRNRNRNRTLYTNEDDQF